MKLEKDKNLLPKKMWLSLHLKKNGSSDAETCEIKKLTQNEIIAETNGRIMKSDIANVLREWLGIVTEHVYKFSDFTVTTREPVEGFTIEEDGKNILPSDDLFGWKSKLLWVLREVQFLNYRNNRIQM